MNNEIKKHHSETIIKSFVHKNITKSTKDTLLTIIDSDHRIDPNEARKLFWTTIFSENCGELDIHDMQAFIEWKNLHHIEKIQSTSISQLSQKANNTLPIVLELTEINEEILELLQSGLWMFGHQLTDPAARRIKGWREEIMFSEPLQFVISTIHDGYGYMYISGPQDLIEKILNAGPHEDYEWTLME